MKMILSLILGVTFTLSGYSVSYAAGEDDAMKKSIERRQKVELKRFFFGNPKQALIPKTTLSIEAYNDAVKYYQQGDYELAREAIAESIRQDDSNAYAYELLGDIDNETQNLSDARENYQLAYNLNPSKSLKKKIEKLSKQAKVEKKLSTYRDQHFLIKYYKGQKAYEGFELRKMLRNVYRQISKDFAHYMKNPTVVLLYDNAADFKEVTDLPHWVSGVYDGKVRMPINLGGYNEKQLKALATHEVTHAFVAAMSSRRAPAWINEGLAEYEENQVERVDLTIFNQAKSAGTLFTLDQLMLQGSTTAINDATRVSLFYQQSFKVVSYLEKRYGMFRIKELLKAFGKGQNSDQAIRGVLKISIKRLEKEWLNSISK